MKHTFIAIGFAAALVAAPGIGYAQNDFNIDREEMLGSVIGASVGALLGSKLGDGDNELLGAALGGVSGYFVGKRYGENGRWDNSDGYRYRDEHYRQPSHRYRHDHRPDRGHAPRIHVIDQPFRARVNSHVRRGPAPDYRSVDILRRGERVHVVGRVVGTDWFMVSHRGRVTGYVYAPLLHPDNRHTRHHHRHR